MKWKQSNEEEEALNCNFHFPIFQVQVVRSEIGLIEVKFRVWCHGLDYKLISSKLKKKPNRLLLILISSITDGRAVPDVSNMDAEGT